MLYTSQQSVHEFRTAASEVEVELEYPGLRPAHSFITDGSIVNRLPDSYDGFSAGADSMLHAYGLPTIADRYPVLAYGANACPARFADKIDDVSDKSGIKSVKRLDLHVVPFLRAVIPDTLAVWHGQPGQKGSTFAELYRGTHAEGSALEAHISFMTAEQLGIIHASEGETYGVAEIPARLGDAMDASEIDVIAYGALDGQIAVDEHGQPILIDALRHHNTDHLQRMSARQVVSYMLKAAGVKMSVEEHIERVLPLKLSEKKDIQQDIGESLRKAERSRPYIFAASAEAFVGRADFASLPGGHDKHLYNVPETLLAGIRPNQQTVDAKEERLSDREDESAGERRARAIRLIDPARKVSRRAHGELAIRLSRHSPAKEES